MEETTKVCCSASRIVSGELAAFRKSKVEKAVQGAAERLRKSLIYLEGVYTSAPRQSIRSNRTAMDFTIWRVMNGNGAATGSRQDITWR